MNAWMRSLDDGAHAQVRALAEAFTAVLDEAVAAQLTDEEALGSLTPGEVMADPFGTVGPLIDLPAYMQRALPATDVIAVPALSNMTGQAALASKSSPTMAPHAGMLSGCRR